MHSFTSTEPARPAEPRSPAVVRVGIAGATGYAGQELVRLLAQHPAARLMLAMSSSSAETTRSLPALRRLWEGRVTPLAVDQLAEQTEAVFLALPEAAAAEVAPALLDAGARVFDLSGAFRLRDVAARQHWYPATRPWSHPTAYGLTELARDEIRTARLVACPGCYPTAALLALAPLTSAGLLDGHVVIDAKSGVSGAGKTPSARTHFSECHGNVAAYGVFGHRHGVEIEQELGRSVTFVPHLVPLDRGILETIYAQVRPGTTEADLERVFSMSYQDAPFVRVVGAALPEIKHVAYTNFCDIGWRLEPESGRLVLVVCLDNLLKGAAGQAVQNFNVAFGLDERAGLLH